MAVRNKLVSLYQALSAQEKRYVSIWLKKENDDGNDLLNLLEGITGNQKKKSPGAGKNSAAEKRLFYLYQAILRALRSFHEGTSVNLELYSIQMNVEILFNRRLYEQSLAELERLKKLALKFNRYSILLPALELEQAIIIEKSPKNMLQSFEQNKQEILETFSQLDINTRLLLNRQELFIMLRKMFNNRDEEQKTKAEILIRSSLDLPQKENEFLGRHHLLQAKCIYALYINDWKEASKHYRVLLEHWENHPEWINADTITYKKMLSNYLSACHAIGEIAVIPPLLEKIKSIPCSSVEEEAEQFQNIYFIELLHLINTDAFEKLPELENTIVSGLKKYRTKINKARELMFYYNFFVANFCQHKWKEALDWINMIVNTEKSDHRVDIQALARLLRLVIYFELGHFDLLEYELINVERYLRQRKIWYAYEAAVTRLLKKLIITEKENAEILFVKFAAQLDEGFSAGRDSSLPAASELKLWASSHIEKNSMREILRRDLSAAVTS